MSSTISRVCVCLCACEARKLFALCLMERFFTTPKDLIAHKYYVKEEKEEAKVLHPSLLPCLSCVSMK